MPLRCYVVGGKQSGGRGGHAYVDGSDSSAEGGQGGDAVAGDGGRGGDAAVFGDRGRAVGGPGGRGGIGPGGPGGDALIARDPTSLERLVDLSDPRTSWVAIEGRVIMAAGPGGAIATGEEVFVAGGQGGEASQPDGRGGRGGRAFRHFGTDGEVGETAHMRWPYFEPITEAGRGGDAPDTPQYKARRLIVEGLKRKYFASKSLPLDRVWWDREVVPLTWINEQLKTHDHRWRAAVIDDEYEFTDL
jgi:hypothetical protein